LKKSKVLLIYTGGTIGMKEEEIKKSLKPFNFNQITNEVPELNKINCRIDAISFEKPIDSSDVNTYIWEEIGDNIYENYHKYDGFVVLHGTDTMSYTASALSFMFQNLDKPIILTGSQLPIGQVRTDGKENLITSIEIASAKINNESIIKEVAIYFEYQLFRGNRTTKVSSDHFDAFMSYNFPSLADVGVNIKYNHNAVLKNNNKEFHYYKGFDPKVYVVFFYPGILINEVINSIESNPSKIVILNSYGSGNLPISKELYSFILEQSKKNKIFLNVSQCASGTIEQNKYENGENLKKVGVIGVKDMTIEAVIVKSMFLINKFPNDKLKFIENFNLNIAGEFNL
jgi:L-asparaginase